MGLALTEMGSGSLSYAFSFLDPSCRSLTDDEIALVHPLFGDKLDYKAVRIFERREYKTLINDLFSGKRNHAGTAIRNFVYLHEINGIDLQEHIKTGFKGYPNRTLLAHELTHVVQYQNNIPNAGTEKIYAVKLDPKKPFIAYKLEQQATIVEAYDAALRKIGQLTTHFQTTNTPASEARGKMSDACQEAETIGIVIRPHLPAAPHPSCQSRPLNS